MLQRLLYSVMTGVLSVSAVAGAADLRLASGPNQTVMVELFTSEGCNSCPPAEAYLNQLAAHPQLWKGLIPLAFHVDYWDYLGWQDRYAHPAHGQRQRHYAELWRARTVYTPAFVVNGREWRHPRHSAEPAGGGDAVGTLTVDVKGKQLEARFEPVSATPSTTQLHVAVLGMGLATEIRAGENAGRHARHEFVVLAHAQLHSDNHRWLGTLPVAARDWGAQRHALVAWVSRAGDPTPLQATGGYLPGAGMRRE